MSAWPSSDSTTASTAARGDVPPAHDDGDGAPHRHGELAGDDRVAGCDRPARGRLDHPCGRLLHHSSCAPATPHRRAGPRSPGPDLRGGAIRDPGRGVDGARDSCESWPAEPKPTYGSRSGTPRAGYGSRPPARRAAGTPSRGSGAVTRPRRGRCPGCRAVRADADATDSTSDDCAALCTTVPNRGVENVCWTRDAAVRSVTVMPDDASNLIRYSGHGEFSPDVIARAEGSSVFTEDGRELLDFTSGQMSAILGHSHLEIVATVREQVGRLDAPLQRHAEPSGHRPGPEAGRDAAGAVGEGDAPDHRGGVERGRAADGEAGHRPLRGRLVRPVLARHDPGRRERHLRRRAGRVRSRPPPATSPCPSPTGSGPPSSTPTATWTGAVSSTSASTWSTPSRPAASRRASSSRS